MMKGSPLCQFSTLVIVSIALVLVQGAVTEARMWSWGTGQGGAWVVGEAEKVGVNPVLVPSMGAARNYAVSVRKGYHM